MRMSTYEQALTKAGVPFEFVEKIELDEINHTRGKQLQARLEPLDLNLIDLYRTMLEDGLEPPPLLLWKPGRGMYVPLDGNQRIEAMRTVAKKHQTPFSAYVVSTDDQMVVDRLCWQFNNMVNGRRLSYEEALNHAISFCRKYNQPTAKTAKDWGVKDWELAARVREAELRDLAESKKIDVSKVPGGHVLALSPLAGLGEDILLKATKVVATTGIGQDEIREMVSDVKKARTSADKIKAIEEFSHSDEVARIKAETKNGRLRVRKGRLPREALKRHLDQLERLLNEYEEAAFKPLKDDRKECSELALFVANKLIGIYGLGEYLKGQGVE